MTDRQVIRTLAELEALPVDSVVIDEEANSYQRDTDRLWSSGGRPWQPQQVGLPAVVLHNGGDSIEELNKENN